MDRGIDVIAAATGKIVRVHDGMRDVHMRLFGRKLVSGGAGNHVVIDHGDGWRTLYGHMRRGSVAVKTGDPLAGQRRSCRIVRDDRIPTCVSKRGAIVDPFSVDNLRDCKGRKRTMWTAGALKALNYRGRFLIAAGFADMPLSREALLYRLHVSDRLSRKPKSVFHVDLLVYGSECLRDANLRAIGRHLCEKPHRSEKDAPVSFRLLGRKIAKRPDWPTGEYAAYSISIGIRTGNGQPLSVMKRACALNR